ncbi:MAG: bifunctional pyr operon transcriptional regulator/uracil phosphoribosyltransferase PyrR [Candidatus Dormibacteria bacterium]
MAVERAPGVEKAEIMDAAAMRRALMRMAHEIVERNGGGGRLVLAGVATRGLPLARRLADLLAVAGGGDTPVVEVDASAFRDDRDRGASSAAAFEFDVDGMDVVLVDDVLFHGRTARAALDAVISAGRPAQVQLAVLVDRGHRALPIRADYVGKNVPTALSEHVQVSLVETDGVDRVVILAGSSS